jgi:hypothetical protein
VCKMRVRATVPDGCLHVKDNVQGGSKEQCVLTAGLNAVWRPIAIGMLILLLATFDDQRTRKTRIDDAQSLNVSREHGPRTS